MIQLNKSNGSITIDEDQISPDLTQSELEKWSHDHEIKKGIVNGDYTSYYISNIANGDFSLALYFHKEKLFFFSIGTGNNYSLTNFIITEKQKKYLRIILNSIGGEKTYSWGSVEFSEDQKGGLLSIVIKYKTVL